MRLLEFVARVAVCWLSLTAIVGLAWCVCVTRYKARQRADITRRASYPPPPPAPRPRLADDLLTDVPVPVDVWLTPELSDRLFDDLIAMEGLQ